VNTGGAALSRQFNVRKYMIIKNQKDPQQIRALASSTKPWSTQDLGMI
jgi:hypothetical protein